MNKLKMAMFAGICLVAANSSAYAAADLSDTLSLGESKTYTLTFGPEVTDVNDIAPYVMVQGHGDFGRYVDYVLPDGTISRQFDISFILPVEFACTSMPCMKGDSAGNGSVSLKVFTSNNQIIVTLNNQYAGYDHCTDQFSSLCAVRVHSPMYLASGFKLNGEFVDYTFTTTQNSVPEPATWAMMIAGFGLVGATLRRKTLATA